MEEIDKVKEYIEKVNGTVLTLSDGRKVDLLKADIKTRKESAFLIYRYQLIFEEPKTQFANLL